MNQSISNRSYCLEPDAKKVAGGPPPPVNQNNIQANRPQGAPPSCPGGSTPNMGGPPIGGGPQLNEDIKVPDKMVGLSKYCLC